MFKADLKKRMEGIFGFKKTTFDAPSDQYEQDTLFIDVIKSTANTGEGKATAKVMGVLTVYSQLGKLPYGYFNKKIQQADAKLTDKLFFHNIDQDIASSPARTVNISERRTEFVFLYSEQYDPNQGELQTVEFCK